VQLPERVVFTIFAKNIICMGLIYAAIEIINAEDRAVANRGYIKESEIRRTNLEAMVGSGAYMLAINEEIKMQLGLREVDKKLAVLADGTTVHLPVVGPVEIRFSNRKTITTAMVLPGNAEVLLGAIPMEDMDVIIDPLKQQLIVHPERPYIPKMSLKYFGN
jgi:clan AA aspartic protease